MIQVPHVESPLFPARNPAHDGALLRGSSRESEQQYSENSLATTPEYQIARMIKRILDHALVKDAVTALHQEHDAHLEKLAACEGDALHNMLKDEETFLRDQERRYSARFAEERQRSLFRAMTGEYFAQAMESAKTLRNRMVLDFQRTVIGKQNQEFVERALLADNLFNDELQTAYRDLILYNLENLHADLPDAERKNRLDEAAKDYYQRIIEKRLAEDPARLDASGMLSSPAVRRVLGKTVAKEYAAKAETAARDEFLSRTAQQWVDEDIPIATAKIRIATLPEPDRPRARELYRYWRYRDNRRRFLELIITMEKAWRIIADGGHRIAAIPAGIRHNHPDLYALFTRSLEQRGKNGGQPLPGDYSRLADLVIDHHPTQWGETLRDPSRACRFIEQLGGPDGVAFQAALRFLIGKTTDENARFFADLRTARAANPDMAMDDFVKARRILMERKNYGELSPQEVSSLVRGA